MNYWQVYTFETFFVAVIIVACMVFSALFNTYIFIKVRKSRLLWRYLLVQAAFVVWLACKILELVSPAIDMMIFYLNLQHTASLILVPACFLFLLEIAVYDVERRLTLNVALVFFLSLLCAGYAFFFPSRYIAHFAPSLSFLLCTGCIFFNRHRIFAELSEVSLDAFMEGHEDAVVIFDRSGILMDHNQSAVNLTGWLNKQTNLNDFLENLCLSSVSENMSEANAAEQEPIEIRLEGPLGLRYYLYNRTIARNKKNKMVATVLSFHDVTEKTVLLQELELKNTELDRMNRELQNYLAVAARLEEEKEKNRVFQEIQETIGGRLTELIEEMEWIRSTEKSGEKPVVKKLDRVILRCRELMADIRLVVNQLLP